MERGIGMGRGGNGTGRGEKIGTGEWEGGKWDWEREKLGFWGLGERGNWAWGGLQQLQVTGASSTPFFRRKGKIGIGVFFIPSSWTPRGLQSLSPTRIPQDQSKPSLTFPLFYFPPCFAPAASCQDIKGTFIRSVLPHSCRVSSGIFWENPPQGGSGWWEFLAGNKWDFRVNLGFLGSEEGWKDTLEQLNPNFPTLFLFPLFSRCENIKFQEPEMVPVDVGKKFRNCFLQDVVMRKMEKVFSKVPQGGGAERGKNLGLEE